MKKLIAFLLTLSTLFAASCAAIKPGGDVTTETKKAPDKQTTEVVTQEPEDEGVQILSAGILGRPLCLFDESKHTPITRSYMIEKFVSPFIFCGVELDPVYYDSTHTEWLDYDTNFFIANNGKYYVKMTEDDKVIGISCRSGPLFGLTVKKSATEDEIVSKLKGVFDGYIDTSIFDKYKMKKIETPQVTRYAWGQTFGDTDTMNYFYIEVTVGNVNSAVFPCNSGVIYSGIPDDFNSEQYKDVIIAELAKLYVGYDITGFEVKEKTLTMKKGKPYLFIQADPITINPTTGEEEDDYYYFGFLIPVK